jgi:putative DNA primase/helicase
VSDEYKHTNTILLDRCPAILHDWLPGGKTVGRVYQCSDLTGGNGDSLKVNFGGRKAGVWKDHAQDGVGGGDLISLYAAIHGGIPQHQALHQIQEVYNLPRTEPPKRAHWIVVTPVPESAYSIRADGSPNLPEIEATKGSSAFWYYTDRDGNLLCFRVRWDKAEGKKDVKPLTWRRNLASGEEKWWLGELPTPLPVYNLFMLASRPKKVLIVEGEKAADAAQRLLPSWCVITWAGGVQRAKYADWSPVIDLPAETRIVLWPDNDRPGLEAMAEVAQCVGCNTEHVRLDPSWPKGYDIADLERDGWTTAKLEEWIANNTIKVPILEKKPRIEVDLTGKDLFVQSERLHAALKEANAEIYQSAAGIVSIRAGLYGTSEVNLMTPQEFVSWSVENLDTYSYNGNGKVSTHLSEVLSRATLYRAYGRVPPLHYFSYTPMFNRELKLIDVAGYNSDCGAYITLPSDYDSDMPIEKAWDLLDDWLADFPWEAESDKTHALAYVLTWLLRDAIEGPIPLTRFEAPTRGTGKSLAAFILNVILNPNPVIIRMDRFDEPAFAKLITAALVKQPPAIMLDNAESLRSMTLKLILTTMTYTDRILGESRIVTLPIRNNWAVTLNNPVVDPEIFRRSVRSRLNAKMENPEIRNTWRHPHLISYTFANRGPLLSAFVAVAKFGIANPKKGNYPTLGMYESWCAVLAPILAASEYLGFLENREEDRESTQESDEAGFYQWIEYWADNFGGSEVTVHQLLDIALRVPCLPGRHGKDGIPTERSIGTLLRDRRDTIVNGKCIRARKGHMGVMWWYLTGNLPKNSKSDEQLTSEAGF